MSDVHAGKPGVVLPVQYLRGVAAMMVVWHHAIGQIPAYMPRLSAHYGAAGVDLFFVISGFVIVLASASPSTTPAQFIARRLQRVVPMYWLFTLVLVAVAAIAPQLLRTTQAQPAHVIESLLFVPHYSPSFPTKIWPLLVPGWSLNYEMFFYTVFALVLLVAPTRRLTALALCMLALASIGLAWGPFSNPLAATYTSSLLLQFLLGAAIATLWLRQRFELPAAVSLLLGAVGVALLLASDNAVMTPIDRGVGAALMLIAALDPRALTWKNRLLQALGDASYSIYLSHILSLGILRVAWVRLMPYLPDAIAPLLFILSALAFAGGFGCLVYRWVEAPMLHWFAARRAARPAPLRAPVHELSA